MKKEIMFFIAILILSTSFAVAAADVAYLYKANRAVDKNIVGVFEEMNMTVEKISDKKIPTTDFEDYKIIFIGDEIFRNDEKIPIGLIPTIISNFHHGEVFGLTDEEGISQLASTSPLSVNIGNKSVVQVYTKAKYNSRRISIPYYHLEDQNKADGMMGVARTYIGNRNGYNDFGDVISYSKAGLKLRNGNVTQSKLCFFGIVESDYWTPEAKRMFKECIGFVSVVCESDNDCGDANLGPQYCSNEDVYQDVEKFKCVRPGTERSECVADVDEKFLEDCGNNSASGWSGNYCAHGDVYKSRNVTEKGCDDGRCFLDSDLDEVLVKNCGFQEVCINGNCTDSECSLDLDCPNDYSSNNYCSEGGVYTDLHDFSCSNHVCVEDITKRNVDECGESYCSSFGNTYCKGDDVYQNKTCYDNGCSFGSCFSNSSFNEKLVKKCSDSCVNGDCVTRECTVDSDCTADFYSDNYCSADDVYKDFHDFSCNNEGSCVEDVDKIIVEQCSDLCVDGSCEEVNCNINSDCGTNGFTGGKYCTNKNVFEDFTSYTCHNPGKTNSYCSNFTLPIVKEYCDFDCVSGDCVSCYSDLQCGNDGFVGDNYCQGRDVYRNFRDFTCLNPGSGNSDCNSVVNPRLIETCSDACVNGSCIDIECRIDEECNDGIISTVDVCENPGTTGSYCSHTDVNCVTNVDCGSTGYFGDEFCFSDDVFKKFRNSTCVNPGTTNSYCEVSAFPLLLSDCGDDTCGNWGNNYCDGNNVYKKRNCDDKGCSFGECFSNFFEEKVLVENCTDSCVDGRCIERECNLNSDCPNDFYSNNYCSANDVYKDLHDFSCLSYNCSESIIPEKSEECGDESVEFGQIYCLSDDLYKNKTTNDRGCSNNGCFNNQSSEAQIVEECGDDYTSEWGNNYCSYGDIYRNRTMIDRGCSNNGCFNNQSSEAQIVEDCLFGCENGVCLRGIHDVGFIDHSGSFNKISLEYVNGTDISGELPSLFCTDVIKAKVQVKNKGDYFEDIIMSGKFNGISFSVSNIMNSSPGDSNSRSSLSPYISLVNLSGIYNVTFGAAIPIDDNLSDNLVTREVMVSCGECFVDSDCTADYYSNNYCSVNDVFRDFHDSSCVNYMCEESVNPFSYQLCGNDSISDWGVNYCYGDNVWHNRTITDNGCSTGICFSNNSLDDELVSVCEYGCENGVCLGKIPKNQSIDIMLVLDNSGSISSEELGDLKEAALSLVETLSPSQNTSNIGIAYFNSEGHLELSISSNKTIILSKIQSLPNSNGATHIQGGLLFALNEFLNGGKNRFNASDYMIIITDGVANRYYSNSTSYYSTEIKPIDDILANLPGFLSNAPSYSKGLESKGIQAAILTAGKVKSNYNITIFAIGVGINSPTYSDNLKYEIATSPEFYYDAANYTQLEERLLDIIQE